MMKFYNRKEELQELQRLHDQSRQHGSLTVLTGRRRVGKTMLAMEFARPYDYLYLFISKKSEAQLCEEFIEQAKPLLDRPVVGQITRFRDLFTLLLDLSTRKRFILIIDEFQEFFSINASVFSDIQNLWDQYKTRSHMNLIVIGSVYSLMYRIFQDSREPLFNRADRLFFLKPFTVKDMAAMLSDNGHTSAASIFDYYTITGGMPNYLDYLLEGQADSLPDMLDLIFRAGSPLLYEGRNVLVEEFGKEYQTYFSILSLIAGGKTSRPEIESILERNAGGYIDRLENDFALITRMTPILSRPNTRSIKYRLEDNYLRFWFRFVYRNLSAAEAGNWDYIKAIIRRDYSAYSGLMLEKLFLDLLASTKQYNLIGSWWNRSSTQQIDLVAINEMNRTMLLAEVKLDSEKIHLQQLRRNGADLIKACPGYQVEYKKLSLENITEYV